VIEKVGLTGPNASGKGEAARILRKYGYSYFSLSDIIREEASRQGLEHSRENLIVTGNRLRSEKGAGILAEMITLRLDTHSVIDSIRNPEEVNVLKKNGNFVLLGVCAEARIRFERMKQRGRIGDALSFEDFLRMEEKEQSGPEHSQNLRECLNMADILIDNNGTPEDLEEQVTRACGITGA